MSYQPRFLRHRFASARPWSGYPSGRAERPGGRIARCRSPKRAVMAPAPAAPHPQRGVPAPSAVVRRRASGSPFPDTQDHGLATSCGTLQGYVRQLSACPRQGPEHAETIARFEDRGASWVANLGSAVRRQATGHQGPRAEGLRQVAAGAPSTLETGAPRGIRSGSSTSAISAAETAPAEHAGQAGDASSPAGRGPAQFRLTGGEAAFILQKKEYMESVS